MGYGLNFEKHTSNFERGGCALLKMKPKFYYALNLKSGNRTLVMVALLW